MTEPLLLSVKDWARSVGLARDHAYRLVREGRVRSVSVGRKRLIPRSECEAWIEREIREGGEGSSKS